MWPLNALVAIRVRNDPTLTEAPEATVCGTNRSAGAGNRLWQCTQQSNDFFLLIFFFPAQISSDTAKKETYIRMKAVGLPGKLLFN